MVIWVGLAKDGKSVRTKTNIKIMAIYTSKYTFAYLPLLMLNINYIFSNSNNRFVGMCILFLDPDTCCQDSNDNVHNIFRETGIWPFAKERYIIIQSNSRWYNFHGYKYFSSLLRVMIAHNSPTLPVFVYFDCSANHLKKLIRSCSTFLWRTTLPTKMYISSSVKYS